MAINVHHMRTCVHACSDEEYLSRAEAWWRACGRAAAAEEQGDWVRDSEGARRAHGMAWRHVGWMVLGSLHGRVTGGREVWFPGASLGRGG